MANGFTREAFGEAGGFEAFVFFFFFFCGFGGDGASLESSLLKLLVKKMVLKLLPSSSSPLEVREHLQNQLLQ